MPSAVRQGDVCTGHGTYPPRVNDQGSGNVNINGRPAHRQGDHWVTHCSTVKPFPCHDSSASGGSGTVFVNGKPLMRVGDAIGCGSSCASGSGNVFAN